jgi:hypothetical protein
MYCPDCQTEMESHVHGTQEMSLSHEGEYMDIDFECPNGHKYFARITPDDLMEAS